MIYDEIKNIFKIDINEKDYFLVKVPTFDNMGNDCPVDDRPGWMYHSGIRYVRDDVWEWLINQFGEGKFRIIQNSISHLNLQFFEKKDAMKFKLLWNEQLARGGYALD
jgi:hypothetical protein